MTHSQPRLVARNRERLSELADSLVTRYGIQVTVLPQDLARAESVGRILSELKSAGVEIDILVNNAGLGHLGPFLTTSLESNLTTIQVNLVAVTALTRELAPAMVSRGRGRILNVASTAGFFAGPLMAVYYATKAFVVSFSEALANELADTGVTVTALCPGPTRTEFQKSAGMEHSILGSTYLMDSATVARIGYEGMLRGKRIVIPGIGNRFLVQVTRLSPRRLVTAIVRRIQESR
jgi:short-subunit dehydrogenase